MNRPNTESAFLIPMRGSELSSVFGVVAKAVVPDPHEG